MFLLHSWEHDAHCLGIIHHPRAPIQLATRIFAPRRLLPIAKLALPRSIQPQVRTGLLLSSSFLKCAVLSSFPGGCPRSNARCLSTSSQRRSWWDGEETQSSEGASPKDGKQQLSSRIHILGMGNIGSFVAHSLADIPNRPPITLLLHSQPLYESWKWCGRRVSVFKNGLEEHRSGYDINVKRDDTWHSLPHGGPKDPKLQEKRFDMEYVAPEHLDDEQIDSLIVTVKSQRTVTALNSVKHRLTRDSTILFLQNGLGLQEEVNEKVFPDPETRPNYLVGTITHAIYRLQHFKIVHAGMGTTILGMANPGSQENAQTQTEKGTQSEYDNDETPATSRHLLHTLIRTPALTAVYFDHARLLQHRLEKLAMNAVINPLTVIYDCHNGGLLYNYHVTRVMRLLLIEISAVICAMPELQGVPALQARFAPERLRTMALALLSKTRANKSSMLHDIDLRKETEIQYINGYIVRRGEELGIKCALNYMVMQLVFGRSKQLANSSAQGLPIDLNGMALPESDDNTQ